MRLQSRRIDRDFRTNGKSPAAARTGQALLWSGIRFTIGLALISGTAQWAEAAGDFTFSVSPSSQTVTQGGSTTYTITVSRSGGFKGNIAVTLAGLPAGASASIGGITYPSTSNQQIIQTANTTPAGSSTLTFTGTSGSLTHNAAATLVVTALPPDFTLSSSANGLSITQGNSGSVGITVGSFNGFTGTVSFTTAGLPSGVTALYNPTSVTGSGSSTLTLSAISTSAPGVYSLTITGTSGSLNHSVGLTLYLNAAGSGFSVSISPTSQTATPSPINGTFDASATIVVTGTTGFSDLVSFTASVPMPLMIFNPIGNVTGSGSSNFQLFADQGSRLGTYTYSITATSLGGITHTATATVTLAACLPSYQGTLSPSSQSVFAGGATTYQVSLTSVCGFSDTVSFTASGLPSGATATFQPATITGQGSITMTVRTTSSTPSGTYNNVEAVASNIHGTFTSATLIVNPDTTSFTLSPSPASASIQQGASASYAVAVTYANHFRGTVTLTASGLPAGATATFTPSSLTATGTSTLAISTASTTPLGSYPISVTGSSGSSGNVTNLTLVVTQPYGTISGTVTQSDGVTAIPGATVSYYQGGALLGSVTSGSNGAYATPNLIPGDYAILCSATSFKTFISSPVTVTGLTTVTLNFSLPVLTPSGSTSRDYIHLGAKLVAVEAASIIDFEQFTGLNYGTVNLPSSWTLGVVTLTGGQIFPQIVNGPVDPTSLYGTYTRNGPSPPPLPWDCVGCVNTITISFAVPVSNLSFFLENGDVVNVTYTVTDDKGDNQTVTLLPNFDLGATTIRLPSSGIRTVTITTADTFWDFWVDNIAFTQ